MTGLKDPHGVLPAKPDGWEAQPACTGAGRAS